jgi:predicted RNA binding protein YcfA (HicA-like mRNA interferase family)
MPKRYTSRELVKLAEEFGWRLVGVKGDHHNFKHPASRYVVTIVYPQKDVPARRSGYGEKNRTGGYLMRFLMLLEQTETGFAVQAPDLAIAACGENIAAARARSQ